MLKRAEYNMVYEMIKDGKTTASSKYILEEI